MGPVVHRNTSQQSHPLFFSFPLCFGFATSTVSATGPDPTVSDTACLPLFLCQASTIASKTSFTFVLSFTETRNSFNRSSVAKASTSSLKRVEGSGQCAAHNPKRPSQGEEGWARSRSAWGGWKETHLVTAASESRSILFWTITCDHQSSEYKPFQPPEGKPTYHGDIWAVVIYFLLPLLQGLCGGWEVTCGWKTSVDERLTAVVTNQRGALFFTVLHKSKDWRRGIGITHIE